MTIMIKTLALGAGFAALAAATPASAQYYPPYGNAYGYYSHNATNMAAERCAAAVQQRLRQGGMRGILGRIFGVRNYRNA